MKFPKEAWWFAGIIVGGTIFVWAIIQLNTFRQTHPVWFWLIVAIIIIGILGFVFWRHIIIWFYNWRYDRTHRPPKPDRPKNDHPPKDDKKNQD